VRPIINLIRFIVFSNIFVSLGAVALTHLSYILLKLPKINDSPILILVFCSTYIVYNLQRIIRLDYDSLIGKNIGIRLSWIIRNRALLFSSSLLLLLLSAITLFFINKDVLLIFIPLGVVSFLYVVPFISFRGKRISLRQIPFIKIILIAAVWSMVTVALPYINEFGFTSIKNMDFILTLVARFVFVLAITFPFDIRDLNFDSNIKLTTIPSVLGIKPTVILAEILLISYAGLKYYQFAVLQQLELSQFIALLISIVLAMIILAFATKKRPELYYSGLVESTMFILHFGVLLLEY
jgi:4-hydroxybenzoate polyprenyltransferase